MIISVHRGERGDDKTVNLGLTGGGGSMDGSTERSTELTPKARLRQACLSACKLLNPTKAF